MHTIACHCYHYMLDHIRWEDILSVSVSLTYLSGRVTLSVTVRVALPSLDPPLLLLVQGFILF